MTFELSANTQAILLLTAPLIAGQGKDKAAVKPLGPSEYWGLARRLREMECQPSDLLGQGLGEIVDGCRATLDGERLERLLGRGFLLVQAVERWRTRAIWVLSRADAAYPQRLKKRLGERALRQYSMVVANRPFSTPAAWPSSALGTFPVCFLNTLKTSGDSQAWRVAG